MGLVAKFGITGDPHLDSSNYGGHKDYPKESLEYFKKITELIKEHGITHYVDTGDFSNKRFNNFEYSLAIEKELLKQNELTNGNRYSIKGNHDMSSSMTQYEYFIERGLIKPSKNFVFNNTTISMLDYKKLEPYTKEETAIINDGQHKNIVIAHQYFKFENTKLPNFGEAIMLDNYEPFFGTDYLVCGHIHHILGFEGFISNSLGQSNNCIVHYLGCMMRPAYREGHMDNIGHMAVISIYDDKPCTYEIVEIPLWSLEESFNLDKIAEKKEKEELKKNRVDITDVVQKLNNYDGTNIGSPEEIIGSLENIDNKYKDAAIKYLRMAGN